jgi:hypothetical protein
MMFQNNIFLDKNLKHFYYKNDLNFLAFKIKDNAILASAIVTEKEISYEEVFTFVNYFFETMIKEYPDADTMINYPGTFNPFVAKIILENVKQFNFDYCIYYDREKIDDLENFENNIINANSCLISNNFDCSNNNTIGENENINILKECSICSSLRINTQVKPPIKYYRIDSDGYLVEELDEKPAGTTDNFYSHFNLSGAFKTFNVRITDNGNLRFYKKD